MRYNIAGIGFVAALLACQLAGAATTEVTFQPRTPEVGPFPTDYLTTFDITQRTFRRVTYPSPANCQGNPSSACADAAAVNKFDGFSVNPRLRMCFSGPIATQTLAGGIFLVERGRSNRIGINQVFYDPATNCVSAKPNEVLQPGRTYVFYATNDLRDAANKNLQPSKEFKDCLKSWGSLYCVLLAGAVNDVEEDIPGNTQVVSASTFTTMSAQDWLEKARAYVNFPTTPSGVQPLSPPEGFPLAATSSFRWLAQTNVTQSLTAFPIPLSQVTPDVARVAFGLYYSPNFISTSGPEIGTIPVQPTLYPFVTPSAPPASPAPAGFLPTSFHIFYPASAKPAAGYPVAIYLHGVGDSQFGAATAAAGTLARRGIATLAFEVLGHGFGSGSMVELTVGGSPIVLPAPGRGIPLAPDGTIGATDGCIVPGPIAARDCIRQTAVDAFALIRMISTTGGYFGNLDKSRISILGQSLGGIVGTLVAATEPNVRTTVLNVPGGSSVDVARLAGDRALGRFYLGTRVPSLLNVPFGPGSPMNWDFDDNYPLRDRTVLINTVPGAPEIQAAFEIADWVSMPGDALAYASDLRDKKVLIQFAKGDQEVPNPTNSAVIRAANARTSSRYYRADLAMAAAASQLPPQPHRFMANPDIFSTPAQRSVAIAAQEQVAGFIQSNGTSIPNANLFLQPPFAGMPLFETPATLPEELNFLRQPAPPPQP